MGLHIIPSNCKNLFKLKDNLDVYLRCKMNWEDCEYLDNMQLHLNETVKIEEIDKTEQELGIIFPQDYKDFILFSNGSEGEIGERYLVVWDFREISKYYKDCTVEFTPQIYYFANDGATDGYAFDFRDKEVKIISFPSDTIDYRDIRVLSKSFTGFLEYLYNFKWD